MRLGLPLLMLAALAIVVWGVVAAMQQSWVSLIAAGISLLVVVAVPWWLLGGVLGPRCRPTGAGMDEIARSVASEHWQDALAQSQAVVGRLQASPERDRTRLGRGRGSVMVPTLAVALLVQGILRGANGRIHEGLGTIGRAITMVGESSGQMGAGAALVLAGPSSLLREDASMDDYRAVAREVFRVGS